MSNQDPKLVQHPNDMETELAVNSIINNDHNYTNTTENNTDNKRKRDDLSLNTNNEFPTSPNTLSPEHKKTHYQRLYRPDHKGPYEVIIQDKEKRRISNPFQIGKIIQAHHIDIDHIIRSGKNLNVVCKTYEAANNLVNSSHLKNYNVFVPSNKIYCTGVIYMEPDISETEILNEIVSKSEVISAFRIKRRINNELKNTSFVKLTFNSDTLPNYVSLNYIRMKVDQYIIPVKQCYRCFSYGHTANTPCNNNRLCRDCGLAFHEGPCTNPKKCLHCYAPHSSNSKQCPEFIRQRNIKTRMSLEKEDYNKASTYFPITYKKQKQTTYRPRYQSYADATKINDPDLFPNLPIINNQSSSSQSQYQLPFTQTTNTFSALSDITEIQDNQPITPNIWLRNPNRPAIKSLSKTNYKTNHTQQPQGEQSYSTTHESATLAHKKIQDREHLETLFQNKIAEIRDKLQSTVHTASVKKNIDEVFAMYIEQKGKKTTSTLKKSVSNVNISKNGTKRN